MLTNTPADGSFVGILHFPWPLPANGAALGLSHTATIAEETIRITLPRGNGPASALATSLGFESLGAPEGVEIAPALSGAVSRPPGWGYMAEPDRYQVFAATASSNDAVDPSKISHGFHDWFALVRDWICAWLDIPSIELGTSQATAMSWLRPDGTLTGEGGGISGVVVAGLPPATPQIVMGAFDNASIGEPVPEEHRLLLQARDSMWSKDLRSSVIDAGTAAEVALGTAIHSDLASLGAPQDFIAKTIETANGIVGLHDLHVSLGHLVPVSRGQIMNQLANRRNKAAHAGEIPTENDARQALATATAVVNAARAMPLP